MILQSLLVGDAGRLLDAFRLEAATSHAHAHQAVVFPLSEQRPQAVFRYLLWIP